MSNGWSQRRACALVGLSRARYTEKQPKAEDAPVQEALRVLVGRHGGWGFWKLHHRLRKNGLLSNPKRTLRIYRAMGLNLAPPPHKTPARARQTAAGGAHFGQRLLIAGRHK